MTSEQDYYARLGVSHDASADQIKKAYRKMAAKLHPDVNQSDPASEERFKALNEAYEVLRDDQKRALYDQFGEDGVRSGAGGPGSGFGGDFTGFGDLFEAFFGGGTRTEARSGPARGEDIRYDLEITLEEAAKGAEKSIRVPHLAHCEKCKGSGAASGATPETCVTCHGTGQVRKQQNTLLGSFATVTVCPHCHGDGKIIKNPCADCRGEGRIRSTGNITITVPPGVDTGARIRISGKGNAGASGGASGDLYVVIRVKSNSRFQRQGPDLQTEVDVGIAQAALGANIKVETFWGEQDLTIPAGSQHGQVFKIKDAGMPFLDSRGRGILYVALNVRIPSDLTPEQAELLRKYADLRGELYEEQKGFFGKLKDIVTGSE